MSKSRSKCSHLWPSLELRNSFKSTSKKRYQKTNSGKTFSRLQEKRRECDREEAEISPEVPSGSWFDVVCRALAMVLSCCY
ncbi:unnamed protein product, partial [Brassica oleracea var. botrytis]